MLKQPKAPYFSVNRTPTEVYDQLVQEELIEYDTSQQLALDLIQKIYDILTQQDDPPFTIWPFNRKKTAMPMHNLYLWGGVGRGKSMLMDLFYDTLPVSISKRRIHFHRFMQDVHQQLHILRQRGGEGHMQQLADDIAKKQQVLCFDELQATDVTDATLITRIFQELMARDVTVIATSNRPPASLYQGEVQKERFEILTGLIQKSFYITELKGEEDHRKKQIQAMRSTYFSPLGVSADLFTRDAIAHLSPSNHYEKQTLDVSGRPLTLRTYGEKIVLASFDELCGKPLGAADYLAIAENFEVLILEDIPVLSPEKRNEAKRFVTLIDALYEHHVLLICTAAAPPGQLYPEGHGSFEFERTTSRLIEMQSEKYLQAVGG